MIIHSWNTEIGVFGDSFVESLFFIDPLNQKYAHFSERRFRRCRRFFAWDRISYACWISMNFSWALRLSSSEPLTLSGWLSLDRLLHRTVTSFCEAVCERPRICGEWENVKNFLRVFFKQKIIWKNYKRITNFSILYLRIKIIGNIKKFDGKHG